LDLLLHAVERCWEQDGPNFEIEHRIVCPDGQIRWQMARGAVERDDSGKPVRFLGSSTDITDRKRVEEEIAQLNQFYSALIRTAAEGICAFRIEPITGRQHFVLWNDQMTRITGISMLDLHPDGWDPQSASTPDQLRLAAMVEQIASGRDLRAQHLEGYHTDGRERTICVSTSRVVDAQGETTIVALVQDVTERARAERAACENEARFLQFADSIPHALWMFSADGSQQLFVNPGFERLFGGISRRLLADPFAWVEALDPADGPRVKELLAAELAGPLSVEVRMHADLGENRWLELRMIPIFDRHRRATVYVGMAEEITALKQAEEQRDNMQSQLGNVTRLQAMGEIVAGIAHELAQPLTAIQNFAATCVELVEGDNAVQKAAKPELREYLQELSRQSVRASRIVSGFRNLSRRRPPQRERVTLKQLIDDTLSLMTAELRRRRVRVQVDSPQPSPDLYIDCVQLQQVLINLIRNAADAMEDLPERQRRVTLSSRVEGHKVKIVCADRGPGLGDIDDSTLFRPFYTTKSDGTGMGLPICRSIIEGHGGSISFRNGQQQGAVFELTIPLT
jgi:PAS domain S-box-containing protein